jgi:hypothetical protein
LHHSSAPYMSETEKTDIFTTIIKEIIENRNSGGGHEK